MIRDVRGITITAGDVRAPLLVRLFSRRERWFDRHRMCRVTQRGSLGWDGSRLVVWECANRQCARYMSAWVDDTGYPIAAQRRP